MPFASAGAQPEIGVRIRASGDDVRGAFDRIKQQGRQTFDALNRSVDTTRSNVSSVAGLVGSTVRGAETVASGAIGVVTGLLGNLAQAASFAASQFATIATAAGVTGVVAGAGFAGALSAVGSYVDKNQEAVNSLVRLSEQTGLSVQSMSAMQAAVRLAGGDTENLNKSVAHLSDAYFKSAQAGDEASSPFLHIGVATKDATGRLRPFSDVMMDTVHALAGIPNVAERGRAAMEVFGDSYRDVLDIVSNETDQKGLVTTFEDRLRAAYAHGTVLDEAKAKARQDLETDNSAIEEDLRDVGNTLATAFLPLTGGANPFVKWIAENKEAVKSFLVDLGSGLGHFRTDIETILGSKRIATRIATTAKGKAAKGDDDDEEDDGDDDSSGGDGEVQLHFAFLESVVPILRATRDVVVDLFGAIRGTARLGDTVPALGQLVFAARELAGAFLDTVKSLAAFVGLTRAQLPSAAEVLHDVGQAFLALRDGLRGGDGDTEYPVLQALGQAAREVLGTLGLFAAALIGDRASIETFATGALHVLRDAFEAVRVVVQGGLVPQGNLFAWLDPLIPYVQRALGTIRAAFESAFGQVTFADLEGATRGLLTTVGQTLVNLSTLLVNAFGSMRDAIVGVLPYLRTVAKALGLTDGEGNGDAGQLLIAGLIVWFTGLAPVIAAVAGLVLEFVIALGSLASVLRLVGGLVYPILEVVALALAALFGIPVWVAGVIVAAVAAAAVAIYAYWGSISAGAAKLVDDLKATFGGIVSVAEAVGTAIRDAFTAPFRWIWNLVQQTAKVFSDLWTVVTGGAAKGWEDLRSDWSGLLDLFLAPIRAIEDAFAALWDKLKGGASGAWGFVRHLFGGDREERGRQVQEEVYGAPGTVNEPVEDRGEVRGTEPLGPDLTPERSRDLAARDGATTPPDAPAEEPRGIVQILRGLLSPGAPSNPASPQGQDALGSLLGSTADDGPLPGEPEATPRPPEGVLSVPTVPQLDLRVPSGSLDDALGEAGGSLSTARTLPGQSIPETRDVPTGAPLTLVIGGQAIDGLTYSPDALEQLRQAQRSVSISGRAPAMRGSGY